MLCFMPERTLGDADDDEVVVLAAPRLEPARARRLAELGLRAGARVRVLHRSAGGGRILAVDDARIAVDRATLRRIPVRPEAGEPLP